MTVEQKIFEFKEGEEILLEKRVIEPGKDLKTPIIMVASEHPHQEESLDLTVSCDKDDNFGEITYPALDRHQTRQFSGDRKPFFIIKYDGKLGVVEWEHIPSLKTP